MSKATFVLKNYNSENWESILSNDERVWVTIKTDSSDETVKNSMEIVEKDHTIKFMRSGFPFTDHHDLYQDVVLDGNPGYTLTGFCISCVSGDYGVPKIKLAKTTEPADNKVT